MTTTARPGRRGLRGVSRGTARRVRLSRRGYGIAGLLAAALVGAAAWALFGSSLLAVRTVQVSGSGTIPRQQVLAAAAIRIGTPLIRVDTSAVARRVAMITDVQSVQVRRSWPDAIVISTVPRTPVFAVREGSHYDVVDSYGVILGRSSRPGPGLVLLKTSLPAPALRTNAGVLAAGGVVRRLPAWLRHRLAAVRTRGSVVILILRGRITVVWGSADAESAKAATVAVLLRTKASYYDVSDPQSAVTGWPSG